MNEPKTPVQDKAYAKLIDGLCALFEMPTSHENHERMELDLGGVLVTLIPSGSQDEAADGLAYFAELGPAPKDNTGAFSSFAASLLEANVLLTGVETPHFSLHPSTRQVVLSGCVSIDRHTPASVHELLLELPEFAEQFLASAQLAGSAPERSFPDIRVRELAAATPGHLQLRKS